MEKHISTKEIYQNCSMSRYGEVVIPITEINSSSSSFDFLAQEPDLYSKKPK